MGESRNGRSTGEGPRARLRVDKIENGRYHWRVKAPNGRTVATSATPFGTPGDAQRAFDVLCEDPERLSARISHVKEGSGWVWVVAASRGAPVARSMRAYERYATCQNAFRKFVALLADDGERADGRDGTGI